MIKVVKPNLNYVHCEVSRELMIITSPEFFGISELHLFHLSLKMIHIWKPICNNIILSRPKSLANQTLFTSALYRIIMHTIIFDGTKISFRSSLLLCYWIYSHYVECIRNFGEYLCINVTYYSVYAS